MRILMLSDVYFPRINGVSTSIATFRRELDARGHDVTLVAPDYPKREDEKGVHRIPARPLVFDPEDRMMRWRSLQRLTAGFEKGRFDLVHIQTPFLAHRFGVRVARALGIPVVESYHTFFEEYFHCYLPWLPGGALRWAARQLTRQQCNGVDGVIVPSSAMAGVLERYGVRTPLAVIPTGIELDRFGEGDGAAFRRRYGIEAGAPVLLYVGRVAHEKNLGFLLHVVNHLRASRPDLIFVIAGEGPARPWVEAETRRLGLEHHVRLVGYLSRHGELQDCYRAADLFVFASRTETQGLVLLEAMALGVPVVSTAVMGTTDVVQDGKGALVAREEVIDFAIQVERVLSQPELKAQLSDAARQYAHQWSAPEMADRLAGYYLSITRRFASVPAGRS